MSTQTIPIPTPMHPAADKLPSLAASAQRPLPHTPATLLGLLPGVALLFSIGLLGKLLERLFHYLQIEYVLWACLLYTSQSSAGVPGGGKEGNARVGELGDSAVVQA